MENSGVREEDEHTNSSERQKKKKKKKKRERGAMSWLSLSCCRSVKERDAGWEEG